MEKLDKTPHTPGRNFLDIFKNLWFSKKPESKPQPQIKNTASHNTSPLTGENDSNSPPVNERNIASEPLHKLLAFDLLLDKLRDAYQMEESLFEKQGFKDGSKLGDPNLGKAQIEHIFQAGQLKEEALEALFKSKIEALSHRKAQLKEEISQLKKDLDEMDPSSKAYKIKEQIVEYQEKLRQGYEDYYDKKPDTRRFQEILQQRVTKELTQAEQFQQQQQFLFEEMQEQLKLVTEELKRDIKSRPIATGISKLTENKHDQKALKRRLDLETQESKIFVEKIRESMGTLHDLYQGAAETLKQQNIHLRDWYNGISEQIRKDLPSVHSRFYLSVMGIFLLTVIFGEIYLINELTTQIFNIHPDPGIDNILPSQFYQLAHVLFCIGYPIGLGMIVKYYLAQLKAQNKKPFRFVVFLLYVAAFLILSVAILNSIQQSDKASLGYLTSLQLPAKVGAFLGVSFVFSFVTGLMFTDFFEAYERYEQLWEVSPFHPKPPKTKEQKYFDAHQKLFSDAIEELRAEKKELVQALLEKEKALHSQDADILNLPKNWNFKEILDHLKKSSVAAYLRGYQIGRIERQKSSDYQELLDDYRKSQIIRNYPGPLVNGTKN